MRKISRDTWAGYRKQAQNYTWPWTLLVISVGIIFFQLGKVSRTGQPYRRAPNQSMLASPVFPVPNYRPGVAQKRAAKPRLKGRMVMKSAKPAKKSKSARHARKRRQPVRAGTVGVGPKIVHE